MKKEYLFDELVVSVAWMDYQISFLSSILKVTAVYLKSCINFTLYQLKGLFESLYSLDG